MLYEKWSLPATFKPFDNLYIPNYSLKVVAMANLSTVR